MGDVVIVHLMRHAPTKENLEKRYIGWTDSSLADASLLNIVDSTVTKVYGSDLQRCRETAARYFPNATYVSDRRFRESNFGEFEGLTYEDLQSDPCYCAWLDDPVQSPPPMGEGFDGFVRVFWKGSLHYQKGKMCIISLSMVALFEHFS